MSQKRTFQIYRYDPDKDAKPYMQTIEIELDGNERMLLDALVKLKKVDPTISFRRSCREGVCGSDAMNINGKNGLACLTNMRTLPQTIVLKPLPGLPVIRDLYVDMTQFFKQYDSIKPVPGQRHAACPKKSACSRPKSAKSSTACTSASCAPAARPAAPASGGTPTSSWVLPVCCRPTASSLTAAIKPLPLAWTTWKTHTVCSVATPS
jgi:succinate dehydrogenase/fumarate reductase iron-sulfur protein